MSTTWESHFVVKALHLMNSARFLKSAIRGRVAKVLSTDMRLNMAFTVRYLGLYRERQNDNGLIKPVQTLLAISQEAALAQVAKEVEKKNHPDG